MEQQLNPEATIIINKVKDLAKERYELGDYRNPYKNNERDALEQGKWGIFEEEIGGLIRNKCPLCGRMEGDRCPCCGQFTRGVEC